MEFKNYSEFHIFQEGLMEFGIELTDRQYQQFIDFYELLIEKNKVMNLTTITELKEVINKHFLDSLSIVKVIKFTDQKVLDLGTGAGFPGIPLKILYPDIDLVLLDSLNKRLIFLDEVIQKLQLKKTITLHGRAEDYGNNITYREQFDLCVSRAVAKLSSLSEYCLPFVKKGGFFIPYKSGKVDDEIEASENALKILGAQQDSIGEFKIPGTDIERTLIVIRKIAITPKKYPRDAGKPSKEPL